MRILVGFMALALTGCSYHEIKENFEQQKEASKGRSSRIVDLSTVKPESLDTLLKNESTGSEERKTTRNKVQSDLLIKSEINCSHFIEGTHNYRAATNLTFGTLTTIASTAAAIVSGNAAQNLAGSAAVLSATSNSVNHEFYSGILMPALTKEIIDSRKQRLNEIKLDQKKPETEYPHAVAVIDALQYHNLCSIPFALVQLVNKTTAIPSTDAVSGAVAALNSEIKAKEYFIANEAIDFSAKQKEELRNQMLELIKRRDFISSGYAFPPTSTTPPPVDAEKGLEGDAKLPVVP